MAGAAGFVGTNLVTELCKNGCSVRGVLHKKVPKQKVSSVEYLHLDLTIPDDCEKAVNGIDIVFMCAANSSGAAVIERKPLTHLTPNVVMNSRMLEAAYAAGVKRFVFISSNTVYPLSSMPVSEGSVDYSFFSKYHIVGWMKLFSEKMCEMYSSHVRNPMQTLVIRPGNLYGPFDKYAWSESKVIAALVRRFAERQNPLEVWGDGNDIKDFLYIDDFIRGLLLAVNMDDVKTPLNLASGIPVTIKDVISALKTISGSTDLDVVFDASKPSMIPVRLIDASLASSFLDWRPSFTLQQGLEETFKWYLDFYRDACPEDMQ